MRRPAVAEADQADSRNLTWLRDCLAALAAGASLLLASMFNFLLHNGYPLLRLDVAIVVGTLIAIALVMAPFYASQRRWGRSLLEGLLVAFFADLNSAPMWLALSAGAAVGLIGWWFRWQFIRPLAVFGAVVLLTTLAGAGARAEWLRTETKEVPPAKVATPPYAILHLILDEQIGPEGLRSHVDGMRLRGELQRFFLIRNFALYGRAYSEHMHTKNALPAVLNYGERPPRQQYYRTVITGRTSYFTELHQKGFRLHVLQNDYAELCLYNPVTECTTYDYSSLRPTIAVPLSTFERVNLIGLKFIAISKLNGAVLRTVNKGGRILSLLGIGWSPLEPDAVSRTSTVAALAVTDKLSHRLRQAKPGDMYFAHLLLPHYPHVVRADCSFLPWSQWQVRASYFDLAIIQRSYAEQDRCALEKVAGLIRAFEESEAGKHGVIIIHGDHGSRLMRIAPVTDHVKHVGPDDIIIGHSTLFAVRGTQPAAQYFEMPQPIPAMLRDFSRAGFQTAPQPKDANRKGFVMADKNRVPQYRAALPRGW